MTNTPRLALDKPADDGSDLVNVATDLNANYDRIDQAVGFQSVTSSTRPSTPYAGKPIMESDTSYRSYFHNGTAPASAGWVEIPNGSATYNSDLKLASTRQLNIGASGATASISVLGSASTVDMLSGRVTGDTLSRWLVDVDGTMAWGPGNAATDVGLIRSGVGVLTVQADLAVTTTSWTTYVPTVSNAGTATWAQRLGWYKKLGKIVFIEVYLAASAAGSGTTTLTVSLPSTPYREGGGLATTQQLIPARAQAVAAGTNSSVSGTSSGVVLQTGSGAVLDQLRGPTDIVMRGEQIGLTTIVTVQGWYREA